jgi:hypothetical protein
MREGRIVSCMVDLWLRDAHQGDGRIIHGPHPPYSDARCCIHAVIALHQAWLSALTPVRLVQAARKSPAFLHHIMPIMPGPTVCIDAHIDVHHELGGAVPEYVPIHCWHASCIQAAVGGAETRVDEAVSRFMATAATLTTPSSATARTITTIHGTFVVRVGAGSVVVMR